MARDTVLTRPRSNSSQHFSAAPSDFQYVHGAPSHTLTFEAGLLFDDRTATFRFTGSSPIGETSSADPLTSSTMIVAGVSMWLPPISTCTPPALCVTCAVPPFSIYEPV